MIINTIRRIRRYVEYASYHISGKTESEKYPIRQVKNEKILSQDGAHVFYGYHDRTPLSHCNQFVLAHAFPHRLTRAAPSMLPLEWGYFDIGAPSSKTPIFHKVGITEAWSWQQASMLCWHPAESNRLVFVNESSGTKGVMALYDIHSREVLGRWDKSFYSISPDGKQALCLDMSRLAQFRDGYGIPSLNRSNNSGNDRDQLALLELYNIDDSSGVVLLDTDTCAKTLGRKHDSGSYFNHAVYSPDGRRASVFYVSQVNGTRMINVMFIDLLTGALSTIDWDRLASHYCWLSPTSVLLSNRDARMKWHLSVYDVESGNWSDLPFAFSRDGHPMANNEKGRVVMDTLPDKRREQHVYLSDSLGDSWVRVASFHSPWHYTGVVRCDLHPRFSPDGSRVCVDRVLDGKRVISVLKL